MEEMLDWPKEKISDKYPKLKSLFELMYWKLTENRISIFLEKKDGTIYPQKPLNFKINGTNININVIFEKLEKLFSNTQANFEALKEYKNIKNKIQ